MCFLTLKQKREVLSHRIATYIVVFLLLETISCLSFYFHAKKLKSELLLIQNEQVENNYNALIQNYHKFSDALYNKVINKEDVLSLFAQANHAPDSVKAIIRAELYNKLSQAFTIIDNKNYRIFHFHLPNGESFLRFHRPEKFGDNLLNFRYSVELVNSRLEYIEGFEEGRIENSYRFIHPLFYKGKHIGSVETSLAIRDIKEEIGKVFKGKTLFLLRDSIVNIPGFVENSAYYLESSFENYKLYNKGNDLGKISESGIDSLLCLELNKKLAGKVQSEMSRHKVFTKMVSMKGKKYLLTFLPIRNIKERHVGYLLFYQENKDISRILQLLRNNLIWASLANLLFLLLLFAINRHRYILQQQRKQILKEKIEAENSERKKESFLANMSHEIRTPLNSIIGFSDMLVNMECTPEEKTEYLNIIQNSGESLLNLINDIIDFSKIEAGEIQFIHSPFKINELMNNLEEIYHEKLRKIDKDLELIKESPESDEFEIVSDRFRLQQVFVNLLDNAIKFTDEGFIRFGYRIEDQHCYFYVEDSGIGIPEDMQEAVFKRFKQIHSKRKEAGAGVGLGLAISRQIVLLLGGQIELKPTVPKGSRFEFYIPLK